VDITSLKSCFVLMIGSIAIQSWRKSRMNPISSRNTVPDQPRAVATFGAITWVRLYMLRSW
jgi:hypothetical protein